MNDIFSEVKNHVSAADAAAYYGAEIKRGYALCPFHAEKTPSLHFLESGNFYCFGCGAKGSAIDYTALFFGESPLEAAKRLNADFALGLDVDGLKKPDTAEITRRREADALYHAFESWREETIRQLCQCYRLSLTATPDTNPAALLYRESVEAWLDALNGTPDEQMGIYRMKGGLARCINQILRPLRTK